MYPHLQISKYATDSGHVVFDSYMYKNSDKQVKFCITFCNIYLIRCLPVATLRCGKAVQMHCQFIVMHCQLHCLYFRIRKQSLCQ